MSLLQHAANLVARGGRSGLLLGNIGPGLHADIDDSILGKTARSEFLLSAESVSLRGCLLDRLRRPRIDRKMIGGINFLAMPTDDRPVS